MATRNIFDGCNIESTVLAPACPNIYIYYGNTAKNPEKLQEVQIMHPGQKDVSHEY